MLGGAIYARIILRLLVKYYCATIDDPVGKGCSIVGAWTDTLKNLHNIKRDFYLHVDVYTI